MRYQYVCAYRAGQLAGMGIWGIDIRNGNATLSELLALDAAAAESVLSAIMRSTVASGCPLMLAISSRADLVSVLIRCGFIRSGSIPFIVRKLTGRTLGANVHTHSNWDLFGADLDTF
jgi:hypothetical protein